ncbi:Dpi35p [Sporobolomyces salmoneus]|uniref:Dpi35p n=1 Tax=Sporobolomyces salmoneus TaxID=183962 RepID=UPI0031726ADA
MVIRRVLLDAFGTVFSPTRPVVAQYTEVARSYGLAVEEENVKVAFKRAFKQWLKAHQFYGKHSNPPLQPGDWWKGVIDDTFRLAGVSDEKLKSVSPSLSTSLIERFQGSQGYSLHSEFLDFLDSLEELNLPPPAIVSNTDPALVKIVDNLGVSEHRMGRKGIRTKEIFTTWDLEKEKQEVGFWDDVFDRLNASTEKSTALKREEILVVGDELVADYETPRRAGFQSLLLRRSTAEDSHANPSYIDEIDGRRIDVHAVRDLTEVIDWIKRENGESAVVVN